MTGIVAMLCVNYDILLSIMLSCGQRTHAHHADAAMGKMRNCGMRNAEGKMLIGMCGATVIGRDVTSRDFIYSAFHHTLCINCVEVNCILRMRKIAFCTMHATFRCWFLDNADQC